MTGSVRRRILACGMALAILGSAGCAAPPTPPEEGGLPDGVAVELRQLRDDVQFRQAQLVIRNDGSEELEVSDFALVDPRFDGPITRHTVRTSRIAPGSVVEIRVELPPVECSAPDDGVTTLSLEYTADGEREQADVDVPDPLGFAVALHARECRAEALQKAVDLEVAEFEPSPSPDPARLVLRARGNAGNAAVTIIGIQATPLLAFDDPPPDAADYARGWPIDLEVPAGSREEFEVIVPVLPNRCDPHVIQEDKRGTLFTIDIVLAGEPGAIELASPPELKGRMLQWVADWCGMAGF